jgi:hypothetical protein
MLKTYASTVVCCPPDRRNVLVIAALQYHSLTHAYTSQSGNTGAAFVDVHDISDL